MSQETLPHADRLPDEVVNSIAKNLGWDPDDDDDDFGNYVDQINAMSEFELLERFLTWQGMIGYTRMIRDAVFAIYQVEQKT